MHGKEGDKVTLSKQGDSFSWIGEATIQAKEEVNFWHVINYQQTLQVWQVLERNWEESFSDRFFLNVVGRIGKLGKLDMDCSLEEGSIKNMAVTVTMHASLASLKEHMYRQSRHTFTDHGCHCMIACTAQHQSHLAVGEMQCDRKQRHSSLW